MKTDKWFTKLKLDRKAFGIVFFVEIILGLVLFFFFFRMISLNTHDDINYVDISNIDKIECTDGKLIVNNVSVLLPQSDNISYDISYAWAETDVDYPTIPRTAIASYYRSSGVLMFDISLYKDSFIPKSEIPDGKVSENWFDDWMTSENDPKTSYHASKKIDGLSGFLVSSVRDSDVNRLPLPISESFYFSVSDESGIYIYVLEGTLSEASAKDSFIKSMDHCMSSIKVSNSKSSKSKTGTNPNNTISEDASSEPDTKSAQ